MNLAWAFSSKENNLDSILLRKNDLTVRIAVICFILCSPYYFVFHLFGLDFAKLFVLPTVSIYVFSVLLSKLKRYASSKFILILGTSISLFFYSNLLGPHAGAQFLFFALIPLPFLLFEYHQKVQIGITLAVPVLAYCILELGHYAWFPYSEVVDIHTLFYIRNCAISTTFLLLFFSIGTYFISNKNYEIQLNKKNEDLFRHVASLDKAYTNLECAHTELKTSTENLETSIRLQMSMKTQADFATLMRQVAHEVKNPMHMIRGNAEMMGYLKPEDFGQVAQYSRTITGAIDRTEKIVDAMMRYGQTSQGFYPSMLEVKGVLEAIATLARGNCKQKYIGLEIVCGEGLRCFADETRVGQCLINLIANAVQYTPQRGKITLSAEPAWYSPIYDLEALKRGSASAGEGSRPLEGVRISISDTGCGIASDRLPNIFIPDISSKAERHNFGLGLAVVYNTIRDSRGAVTVESEVGKGTTFKLFLPAKEYQPTEKEWAMFADPNAPPVEVYELPEWMRPDRA